MEIKTDIETKIDEAITLFSEVLVVDKSFFKERGRAFPLSSYRSIAIMFCRYNITPRPSLKELGKAFERDHSTIIHSINVGENEIKTNKHMSEIYRKALDKFKKKEYKMEVVLKPIKYNDNDIVDVARVSYGKEADNYTDEQNIKLINYLVNHGHTSPFRHVQLQFIVECPIYVERQIFKHQTGVSVNSISGRYVDFSDSYYKIDQFRTQSTSSKQGSGEDLNIADNLHAQQIQSKVIEWCSKAYNDLLDLGISKEQARSVLPLSLNTKFRWSGSLLAFIHMCNLRLKPDTQKETRDLVRQMLDLVIADGNLKHSLKAFGY